MVSQYVDVESHVHDLDLHHYLDFVDLQLDLDHCDDVGHWYDLGQPKYDIYFLHIKVKSHSYMYIRKSFLYLYLSTQGLKGPFNLEKLCLYPKGLLYKL